MYYIQYVYGNTYIYKVKKSFNLVDHLEFDDEAISPREILRNQFSDKSLAIIYYSEFQRWKSEYGATTFTTKNGIEISDSFYVVRDALGNSNFTLLSKEQVKLVLEDLL